MAKWFHGYIAKREKGFTLIELLTVMAIVLLLAGMSLIANNGARRVSRDNKRKADLEQVRSALEMYRSDNANGEYPSASPTLIPNYLPEWPDDPKSSGGYYYYYSRTPNEYGYEVCASLESPNPPNNCGTAVCGNAGGQNIICNYKKTQP